MIFQPINVWPSTRAIDALRDNTFSVEINTSGSVIAYQLTILDWDNNLVFQGERIELEEPLFNGDVLYFNPNLSSLINGNDYKWRLRLFQQTDTMPITAGFIVTVEDTQITTTRNINIKAGMFIRIGTEMRRITAVSTDEGHMALTIDSAFGTDVTGANFTILSSFIDTNPDYVLQCRTTPDVAITNFANEINVRKFTFEGKYIQQENVPIEWFQWNLYIVQNNVRRMIFDTGKIYRADVRFEYDGYLTGQQYMIELITFNNANMTVQTGIKSFNVLYETVDFLTQPQLFLDCRRHAIRINWTTPISFDPTVLNIANSFSGVVAELNGNTMMITPGLDIRPGAIIVFASKFQNEVALYNTETGFISFRYGIETGILNGTPFTILNNIGSMGNILLMRDNPYRLSNSANVLENVLSFEHPSGSYIGKTPDRDNITFQFRMPTEFWAGVITKNIRLLPIMHIHTEEEDIRGFEIFLNLNKLVYMAPAIDNNAQYKVAVASMTNSRVFTINNAIDPATQKYLRFEGYNYVAEIVDYDLATKQVTLFETPPFDVNIGTIINVYNALEHDFYTLVSQFPLQEQGTRQSTVDYIWNDREYWNDTLYWFEGGGAKYRIANIWFKVRINGSVMDVRAGGV